MKFLLFRSEKLRLALDRRRLEDGFLLYAMCKMASELNVTENINMSLEDRKYMISTVYEELYKGFIKKWGGKWIKTPDMFLKKQNDFMIKWC